MKQILLKNYEVKSFFFFFNCVELLEPAWTTPYSFLGKVLQKWFAIISFLKLRESDRPKITLLALCLKQY